MVTRFKRVANLVLKNGVRFQVVIFKLNLSSCFLPASSLSFSLYNCHCSFWSWICCLWNPQFVSHFSSVFYFTHNCFMSFFPKYKIQKMRFVPSQTQYQLCLADTWRGGESESSRPSFVVVFWKRQPMSQCDNSSIYISRILTLVWRSWAGSLNEHPTKAVLLKRCWNTRDARPMFVLRNKDAPVCSYRKQKHALQRKSVQWIHGNINNSDSIHRMWTFPLDFICFHNKCV